MEYTHTPQNLFFFSFIVLLYLITGDVCLSCLSQAIQRSRGQRLHWMPGNDSWHSNCTPQENRLQSGETSHFPIFHSGFIDTLSGVCAMKSIIIVRQKKSIRFLVIGQLRKQSFFILVIFNFFLPTSEIRDTCTHGYWNQTKFPIHKVRWLREASQVGQTFTPLWMWTSHLKHSTAEFQ